MPDYFFFPEGGTIILNFSWRVLVFFFGEKTIENIFTNDIGTGKKTQNSLLKYIYKPRDNIF